MEWYSYRVTRFGRRTASRSWNNLRSASSLSNWSMHWKHSRSIEQLVSANASIPFPRRWFRIADKLNLPSEQASLCSSFRFFLCVALLLFARQKQHSSIFQRRIYDRLTDFRCPQVIRSKRVTRHEYYYFHGNCI